MVMDEAKEKGYAALIKDVQDALTSLGESLEYKQFNRYSTIEIYHASRAVFELWVHPELYLENNRIINSDISWWAKQTPSYNYSVSGAVFHAWKTGKIKAIYEDIHQNGKVDKLCVKFELTQSGFQDRQNTLLGLVCKSLEIDIQKCITHISTLSDEENYKFVNIELEYISTGQLENDNVFMLFPLVIDHYWFLGCIFLGIYEGSASVEKMYRAYRLIHSSFIRQLISVPLRKEIRDSVLENSQQEIQRGTDLEIILSEALKQYLPFPIGCREDYPADYLEETEEFLIKSSVFPDFVESTWIPKAHYSEKVQSSLQAEIDSLFQEIQKTVINLDERIQSEKIKSDNYRERAIAHTQKNLYRAVASNLEACDLSNPETEDFKIHFLNAQLLSTYIHLTNEMRQQGAYRISGDPFAMISSGIKANYFIEKLYVLVSILLDTSYGVMNELQEDYVRELAEYVKKFVRAALSQTATQRTFPDFHSAMRNQYLDKKIENLEFNVSSRSLTINLPSKRAFFFTLLNSFFEIFANSKSHARQEKLMIRFDENLNRLIISTKEERLDNLLSPSEFYERTKKDSKLTLTVLEQQFKLFGCSYKVSYLDGDDKVFSHVITDERGSLFTINSAD